VKKILSLCAIFELMFWCFTAPNEQTPLKADGNLSCVSKKYLKRILIEKLTIFELWKPGIKLERRKIRIRYAKHCINTVTDFNNILNINSY